MKNIKDIRIAVIGSTFRWEVTGNLIKKCLATLKKRGLTTKQVDIFKVPGSLEIPLIAKKVAQKKVYDAIITFGGIYKGKTYHFEQISNECIKGCMEVSLEYEIPVIFEVLAVYDPKDALDRATRDEENKGVEGALTALEMINIMSTL